MRIDLGVKLALTAFLAASSVGCRQRPPAGPPPAPSAVRAICASDVGGKDAHVQIWRRMDGTIATMELVAPPSIVDAPSVFFDTGGREVERISSHATSPGSPDALDAQRRRDMAIQDGKKAELLACSAHG